MAPKVQHVFLFLILTQAAHSVEECVTKLYDVLAPARFVAGLISDDLARGFLIANTIIVAFGMWTWAFPVRRGWRPAGGLVWFWTILELINGVNHLALAAWRRGYFPGALTAPLLLLFAGWLVLLRRHGAARPAVL